MFRAIPRHRKPGQNISIFRQIKMHVSATFAIFPIWDQLPQWARSAASIFADFSIAKYMSAFFHSLVGMPLSLPRMRRAIDGGEGGVPMRRAIEAQTTEPGPGRLCSAPERRLGARSNLPCDPAIDPGPDGNARRPSGASMRALVFLASPPLLRSLVLEFRSLVSIRGNFFCRALRPMRPLIFFFASYWPNTR